MHNPKTIVELKNQLLECFKTKEDLTKLMESRDFQNEILTIEQEKQKELDTLLLNYTQSTTINLKRLEDDYNKKVQSLQKSKEDAIAKVNTKIEEAKSRYLEQNSELLQPIYEFKESMDYIDSIVNSIPESKLFKSEELPKLDSYKDILKFNNNLRGVFQLEGLKTINTSKIENKAPVILKPIEFFVSRLGEEKRWVVELSYILILGFLLFQYRFYALPAVVIPLTITEVFKLKNFRLLSKYCATYFQVKSKFTEIESQIKAVLLKEVTDEYTSYKVKEISKITALYEREVSKLKKPTLEDIDSVADTSSIESKYAKKVKDAQIEYESFKSECVFKLNNISETIQQHLKTMEVINTECKELIKTFDSNGTLPDFVHLGEIYNNKYGISYPYMHPTLKDSLCVTYDLYSKDDAVNFLKYYLIQLWRYVSPGSVKFHILDSKDFGKDFADLTVNSKKLIEIHTDVSEVNGLFTQATDELKKRNTTILRNYSSIEEYNDKMFKNDASLCPYIVYVNLNPTIENLVNQSHKALLEQASSCGILMINLIPQDIFTELKDKDKDEIFKVYSSHGTKIDFQNNNINKGLELSEDEVFIPIKIPKEEYVAFSDTMFNMTEKGRISPLWYHEFKARNIKEMWEHVPIMDLEIPIGNLNGEKDKPYTLKIGNTNPHAIIAGATGSGKSVLLNAIMLSALYNHSPDWLNIYSLDFKGVENIMYGSPNPAPHMRLVSATRSVEYVLSVFDDLVGEMEARNGLFTTVLNVKDYASFCDLYLSENGKEFIWNKIITSSKELDTLKASERGKRLIQSMTQNGKYPVLPRILFVIDEFADMFLIDEDMKSSVSGRIQTLAMKARSCGLHMIFASQNMEGTVPDQILEQYQLRICLPCSKSVSNMMIGNPEASKLDRGYCIVNNKPAEKEKYNNKVKVAFEKLPEMLEMLTELYDYGASKGYNNSNLLIYQEDEVHESKEFKSKLHKYKKLYTTNTFILGEPRTYQRLNIPVTMTLQFKERQNLIVLSKDKDIMDGLTSVILDNLSKKPHEIIFQTADDTFLDRYPVDQVFSKLKICLYDVECDDMYNNLNSLLRERINIRETGGELNPCYVILHSLSNMFSFGVTSIMEDLQDFLRQSMLEFNKHGIYFIFCTTSAKSVRQLFSNTVHIISGSLEENDAAFTPDVLMKALRRITPNQIKYVNTDADKVVSFKPYQIYSSKIEDVTELFA